MARTKALISFTVTAKLICVFVFVYAKSRFSHDAAQYILKHVKAESDVPNLKTNSTVFLLICLSLAKKWICHIFDPSQVKIEQNTFNFDGCKSLFDAFFK